MLTGTGARQHGSRRERWEACSILRLGDDAGEVGGGQAAVSLPAELGCARSGAIVLKVSWALGAG